jgi:flavin-binding protein dodecin
MDNSGSLVRELNSCEKPEETVVSVAKTTEITATSSKSFEDAICSGIKRFSKTMDKVEGAWVKEQKVIVDDGEVSEYRVTMKVTFILKD